LKTREDAPLKHKKLSVEYVSYFSGSGSCLLEIIDWNCNALM